MAGPRGRGLGGPAGSRGHLLCLRLLLPEADTWAVATQYAEAMKNAVATSSPDLKAAGFHKRRHSFNRVNPNGLVHVVHFWMAPKEPPAWTEVPGLRERLYGSFRVDLGVRVSEITRGKQAKHPGAWVNEYDCDLRVGLTQVMTGEFGSAWWSLDDPSSATFARTGLLESGLPWLDQFEDQGAVVAAFERAKEPWEVGMTPAAGLDIAQIHAAQGRTADERRTLERYVATPVHAAHAEYLRDYLPTVGHPDLVAIVTVRPPHGL